MVDSTTSDIKSSWKDTIQALIDLGGQAVGLKTIAEQQGISKQAVDKRFPEIEENGYIEVDRGQEPYIYKLTGKGYRVVDSAPYGPGQVDSSKGRETGKANRRLHGLTVVGKTTTGELIPEKWMGKMREEERVNFVERQGENNCAVITNRFFLRLHKDSCTIQLREGVDYSTDSNIEAFLEFHSDLRELLEWVERATGVPMKVDLVDLRRCELAFEDHHLAQLVDRIPDLNLSDFAVEDEDIGKEVISLDDSFGPELETKSGEQAEAIGHTVEHEMRQYAERPGAVRKRHQFENEMDLQDVNPQEAVHSIRQVNDVQEQVQDTVTEVERVEEEVSGMKERQDKLLELKREEREKTEALEDLVKNNQELLQETWSKMEDLENSSSSSSSIVNPLAEHVEIASKWEDRWGNIRAYSPELGKQFKLIDSEDLAG